MRSYEALSWPRRIAIAILLTFVCVALAHADQTLVCSDPAQDGSWYGACPAESTMDFASVPLGALVPVCVGGSGEGNCSEVGGQPTWHTLASVSAGDLVFNVTAGQYMFISSIADLWSGGGETPGGEGGWPQLTLAESMALAGAAVLLWSLAWALRLVLTTLKKGQLL